MNLDELLSRLGDPNLMLFLWLALAYPIALVMVVVHELGHAAVGRLLGYRVESITLGSGQPTGEFRIFGLTLVRRNLALWSSSHHQFGYERAAGFVSFGGRLHPGKADRFRPVPIYLAGCLAEVTVFSVLLLTFGWGNWTVAFIQLPVSLVSNLWPRTTKGLSNDGQLILDLVKSGAQDPVQQLINNEWASCRFPPDVERLKGHPLLTFLKKTTEENPDLHALLYFLVSQYEQEDQVEYAVEIARPLKAALLNNEVNPTLREHAVNLVLYLDALHPPHSWDETLLLAESLTDKSQYGLSHTLGALLIRMNEDPEAGLALIDRDELPPVRIEHARTSYFKALAYLQLGRTDLAAEQIRHGLTVRPSFDLLLDLAEHVRAGSRAASK